MMHFEEIWKLDFDKLVALSEVVDGICKSYAETLTTYAVVSNDPAFQRMDPEMEKSYKRRNDFAKLLSALNHAVEERIYETYIKD